MFEEILEGKTLLCSRLSGYSYIGSGNGFGDGIDGEDDGDGIGYDLRGSFWETFPGGFRYREEH
jgi:hypothetical protein